MKLVGKFTSIVLIAISWAAAASTQQNSPIADNAALRYWSAFSEVQDSGITGQQAKALGATLDGTAPYDDSEYKVLLQKNALALKIMARGTSLPKCDWGLDYALGSDLPVDYARKALVLGRLNVLNTFHLLKAGNLDGAVHALAAGLRFSDDVGNGGSLFATLVARSLLMSHLKVVVRELRSGQLSSAQRSELQNAVKRLGQGPDWSMAAKRDLEALRRSYADNSQTTAALDRITYSYVAVLNDESKVAALKRTMDGAPRNLANAIPNVKQILKAKQDLDDAIQQARSALQVRQR